MMETRGPPEMLVPINQTMWCHIPEYQDLHVDHPGTSNLRHTLFHSTFIRSGTHNTVNNDDGFLTVT